jgi:DNA ligase-1
MRPFVQTAEAIRATSKKNEKVSLVAAYLDSRPVEEAAQAAIFFCGRPFAAAEERTLQVGAALLWRLLAALAQISESELAEIYRRFGDLGDAAESVLAGKRKSKNEVSVAAVATAFNEIAAARGAAAKTKIIEDVLKQASAGEAKYIIKIMLGDLRIGLRESLVEEAIGKAFHRPLAAVQRANMMLGNIGETLRLAAADRLAEARMRLFHPMGFMLATPVESAAEAFSGFSDHARLQIEDKYDGIRAQAHIGTHEGRKTARIFSRTRDEVTGSFPELVAPLASLTGEMVLDGEIVAWERAHGQALPFSALQQRLGRKQVAAELQRKVPLAYVAFDVLYANGELLLDRPLRERDLRLDAIITGARDPSYVPATALQGELVFEPAVETATAELVRAPLATATSADELEALFEKARERGNEGLMIKDLESSYTPGRRGGAWLKLKRELATLDVVVTAAEYGHGKRAGALSDYTFAVRDDADSARLLNVGKAYSGLTDVEIADLTKFFLAHTIVDESFRRQVEPLVVLEVAFNNVMVSDRHESGFALRFPRIVRIRQDKRPEEIDTLARVREIYEKQRKS